MEKRLAQLKAQIAEIRSEIDELRNQSIEHDVHMLKSLDIGELWSAFKKHVSQIENNKMYPVSQLVPKTQHPAFIAASPGCTYANHFVTLYLAEKPVKSALVF